MVDILEYSYRENISQVDGYDSIFTFGLTYIGKRVECEGIEMFLRLSLFGVDFLSFNPNRNQMNDYLNNYILIISANNGNQDLLTVWEKKFNKFVFPSFLFNKFLSKNYRSNPFLSIDQIPNMLQINTIIVNKKLATEKHLVN